ncbi:reverse transcriptase domain-containing protein [Tanacetum coccineum]
MHTRASNSKLVEPLPELNTSSTKHESSIQTKNEPPTQPKVVYALILDINYFHHFLDIFENYNPMDDEPLWAADRVVAPTPGSAITIPETANEFAIKEFRAFSQHENETLTEAWLRMKEIRRNFHGHNLSKGKVIKIFYHDLNETTQEVLNVTAGGIFLYKTPNQANQLLEDKYDTDKIMARMDAKTMKMDAQNKELQSRSKQSNLDHSDDDKPIEDEDEESTPQSKSQTPKPAKETPIPKPYKPKIPYPQRLKKEKMEAQYGKFIDMIRAVPINLPLVDVLAGMSNYGKFLKELFSYSSDFSKAFSCNALTDLDASINLMPYSLYAKLSLETLKPTKMSVRLADRLFQHPIGITKNILVEVGKFIFPVNFVILEMEEESKVPLIIGRPFLHTSDAVIRVKQKQPNLGVGTRRMTFHIDSVMKHSYSNDDTCFSIEVIDEILEEDFDARLNAGSKILHSIEEAILEEKLFAKFDKFMEMTIDDNSESESDTEEPPLEKNHL